MSDNQHEISDPRFIDQLNEIRLLKKFLFEEKVALAEAQLPAIDLGDLNNFKFQANGRAPSAEEWATLDRELVALASLLTPELRRKIRIRELRSYFRTLPIIFLAASVCITIFYILFPYFFVNNNGQALRAFFFLSSLFLWTIAQGGLGACAFLGLNVATKNLSTEASGETIDLTDRDTLGIRVVLGATFAFLFGGPISWFGLDSLREALMTSSTQPDWHIYLFLVAPFVLGFSTNLVLALLNRFVDGIKAFFGVASH